MDHYVDFLFYQLKCQVGSDSRASINNIRYDLASCIKWIVQFKYSLRCIVVFDTKIPKQILIIHEDVCKKFLQHVITALSRLWLMTAGFINIDFRFPQSIAPTGSLMMSTQRNSLNGPSCAQVIPYSTQLEGNFEYLILNVVTQIQKGKHGIVLTNKRFNRNIMDVTVTGIHTYTFFF